MRCRAEHAAERTQRLNLARRYVARRSANGAWSWRCLVVARGRRARRDLAADGAAAARPRRGPLRHRARSQRPPAARLHHARRPLAPARRGQGRRPALPRHADGLRGQALPLPPRRRPVRASARAAWQLVAPSPHRLRRLDADHAGGAPAAGRARAHRRRQAAPGAARAGSSSASSPRTRSCASTCASRPSAATSRACAPPRSPTSARSRGACRWRRRPCSWRCRSRPSCAGRTASPRPRGAPATACWPMPPRKASIPRDEAQHAPWPSACRRCAASSPCSPRTSPTPRSSRTRPASCTA